MANGVDDGKKAPPIEIIATCISVLSAAAAIKRILHVCGRNDNRRVLKRCAAMRQLLDNPSIPNLERLAVRDSWEHSDERLDSVLKARRRGVPVAEIHVSATPPSIDQITLRRFDPTSFAIHYLDDSIPLNAITSEAGLLESKMKDAFIRLRTDIVKLY